MGSTMDESLTKVSSFEKAWLIMKPFVLKNLFSESFVLTTIAEVFHIALDMVQQRTLLCYGMLE